jgi:hypothetical protein
MEKFKHENSIVIGKSSVKGISNNGLKDFPKWDLMDSK